MTLARLVINTALRMVYPFAPAFARGLGVPVTTVYQLVTLRNVAGFVSPFFSPLSERYGRRPIMTISMVVLFAISMLVWVWPTLLALGIVLVLTSFVKVVYDPAMQAYIGDTVPYWRRGQAIAITELAWSGGLLVGAPAIGWLLARLGWQSPFIVLGLLGVGTAVAIWRWLPPAPGAAHRALRLRQMVAVLRRYPVVWAAFVYTLLAMAANDTLFIIYGAWMESSFQLNLSSLGIAAAVIGGAEITGELFAGWSVDRFGKRPVIITTGVLNGLLYLLVPYLGQTLVVALSTLFLLFLFFEITIVGGMPLMTELVPTARSVVLSIILAASGLGRALGTWIGSVTWQSWGLVGNGWIAATLMLIAVFILAKWVREGEDDRE